MTTTEALAVGLQYHHTGDLARAEAIYRQILQVDAGHADALHYLGVIAHQQGRHEVAADFMRQSVRLMPANAGCWCNLGLVFMALGKTEDAVDCYQGALRLQPNYPEAHNNLGIAFEQQKNWPEAIGSYRQALASKPTFAEAWYNLGNAFRLQGKLDEAVEAYRQACQHKQGYAKALNNLGTALRQQGHIEEAMDCWQRTVDIMPSYVEARNNLAEAFFTQGQLAAALDNFRQSLRMEPNLPAGQSNVLFCLNHDPHADPDAIFAEHCRWGSQIESAIARRPHTNDPHGERRLRVGYVSGDLCDHVVARYLEPVLAHHDPGQVEVFCYAQVAVADAVTRRLQQLATSWRWTCQLTDAQFAEQIRSDGIDILVDLAGHTANNRLIVFAHEPAPVQATWLGYMNTTGLTTIDYRLTDSVLDPLDQAIRDTEELVRLPGGMCCFAPPAGAPAVGPLPALAKGHLTFGSLNRVSKINSSVIDLWSVALRKIPSARLLVYHDHLTPTAQDHLRGQFRQRGIDHNQLDLRRGSKSTGYLDVYHEIDVILDTFPCTGGVTTCEALWMGVPVLSLRGVRPAGRNSAALLARVGLADLAVPTPADFVARAVLLNTQFGQLAHLRGELRERMKGTICDGGRFTRQLEEAYRALWRRWCANSPPM